MDIPVVVIGGLALPAYNVADDIFVLTIEDFLATKLARSDRSTTDIDDVIQLLIVNEENIDQEYLYQRLDHLDLLEDFKKILQELDLDLPRF